ncbi:MAG: DUF6644 family protein [Polyangiales bacterium]
MSASAVVAALSDTLERSQLSHTLQATAWVVPTVQTVHILSVATVISSALFVSLRLFGISGKDLSTSQVALRFLPQIWWTLPVLFVSGSLLIIAEPARSLQNPAFWLKMSLLVAASVLTAVYQWPLHHRGEFWDCTGSRAAIAKLLAGLTLGLWIGVILAGRWIAYVGNL